MGKEQKNISIRVLADKVETVTSRYVRLRVTINGVSETISCPYDFDDMIDALRTCSVGAESVMLSDDVAKRLESLALIRRATRGNWNPTPLLREHANVLTEAFRQ